MTKLSSLGEFGLIRRIQKLSGRGFSAARIGIGDDAAALTFTGSRDVLVTADLLIENIHFDLSTTDYYSLGWKAAAVNLSDIAAMGAVPRFCLTALGIPRTTPVEQVLEFYRGFGVLLRRTGTELVGGDTCASSSGLFISITALGEAKRSQLVSRSGAEPGDLVFVTGTLGDSAAGLYMLKNRIGRSRSGRPTVDSNMRRLIEKHLRPEPRVREGRIIGQSGCASAMIDVSDGLSSDLSHICEQSGVGAAIDETRIPISPALRAISGRLPQSALSFALSGGEDYELLFTVSARHVRKLAALKLPVTRIGVVTKGRGVLLVDAAGESRVLSMDGYDHFPKRNRVGSSGKRGRNGARDKTGSS
jgi:thiamine-monophosphate kinase